MIITYHGIEFFKVQFGDIVLSLNPISRRSQHKGPHFGADIAFITLDHDDMNGADAAAHGERRPLVISGPGEYEVKGVAVRGFPSVSRYGGEERLNTLYRITLENMRLCFLGALNAKTLSAEAKEALDAVDILFVPIGGDGVLSAADAYKLSVSIGPRIIIPMHYGAVGEKNALVSFLKEDGSEGTKPVEKLTVKRKDTEGREGDIVVLAANA